jgi:RNA polymerase sigma-70 factor, ECF subfamily
MNSPRSADRVDMSHGASQQMICLPDDDAIVRRVLAGESASYAVLVERHQQHVRRVVSGLIEPSAIEALVQQTFVGAYESLVRYKQGQSFSHWLSGIAKNLLKMELRRRIREQRHLKAYHQHLLDKVEAHGVEDDVNLLDAALAECLKGLAPAAAQLVQLRYAEGLGIAEVSARMNRSSLATRQMLFRVRNALRRCVERKVSAE